MMTERLDGLKAAFLSPPFEFGPMPFWFWNDEMTTDGIEAQLLDFLDKGVAGFVLHPRIGMPRSMPYLSESFMAMVRHAVRFAADQGMRVLLYDEAMYPSGSAHGLVVKANPSFSSVGLRVRELPLPKCSGTFRCPVVLAQEEQVVAVLAVRLSDAAGQIMTSSAGQTMAFSSEWNGPSVENMVIQPEKTLVARVAEGVATVVLPENGRWRMLLFVATPSGGTIRGLHFGEDDGEPDAPPSADLLNPEAVRTFISLTHHRYAHWLKPYFGTTVIGFFTDEPCILGRNATPGLYPWTWDFLQDWHASGLSEGDLALLACEAAVPEIHQKVRRNYRQAVSRRLESSYYQPLSRWCETHGISLSGHPEGSMDVGVQKHFGIPGQDLVWRWVGPEQEKGLCGPHSTMAKSTADAARFYGRRRNANECFGCCGPGGIQWAFSADDMKWMLDWLFLRGTNLIIPHAFFSSVDGPGRYGERPPDVGPHNIWWPEFGLFSQYIRRLSWLRTDSREVARVAVVCHGDFVPWRCVVPLYRRGIGFHYLQDAWLAGHAMVTPDGLLSVGGEHYETLLVEDLAALSEAVQALLERFVAGGGQVFGQPEQWEAYVAAVCVNNTEPCLKANTRSVRLVALEKMGHRLYLLGNEGESAEVAVLCVPREPGVTTMEIWQPWTGNIQIVPFRDREPNGAVEVSLRIERREVLVLRLCGSPFASASPVRKEVSATAIREASVGEMPVCKAFDHGMSHVDISGEWTLSGGPLRCPMTLDTLVPWEEIPALDGYCGGLIYTRTVALGSSPDARHVLDFGRVGELLRVWVNGHQADSCLWAPYQLDVTPWLHMGTNLLKLEVVNSLAHRYEPEAVSGMDPKLPGLQSGLMGPVTLVQKRSGA